MNSSVNVTEAISPHRIIFRSQVLAVLEKIKRGYNDVSTFSLVEEVGCIPLSEWIQIAGTSFFDGNTNDDIHVYLSIEGVDSSNQKAIYESFGYNVVDGNPNAYEKWYEITETHLLVEELDQIVYSIAGEDKFERLAYPDEQIRMYSERFTANKRQYKYYSIIGYLIAFLILSAIALAVLLLT